MIANAVSLTEPSRGHDFFVINPLPAITRLATKGDMPLAGDGAQTEIWRHG
jgi:hypothetical protein